MNKRIVTITETINGWHVSFYQTEGIPEQEFIYQMLTEVELVMHKFLTASSG
jgi:hypothetical protein